MKHRWILVAGGGSIFGLAAQAAPARADCVADCFSATYCDREMHASGECGRKLNDCYLSQCKRSSRSYGAIAYGAQSTAAGWAFDFGTAGDAGRRALSNCTQHGDDCKVVVSFSNSCAAVAAGTNKRFATGQASNREQAQANAVAACGREGGAQCKIQAWSCALP